METDVRIEMVLGTGTSFHLSYTVFSGNFSISQNVATLTLLIGGKDAGLFAKFASLFLIGSILNGG